MKDYKRIVQLSIIFFISIYWNNSKAQFSVKSSVKYAQLIDTLLSSGISVSNVKYTGNSLACGYFSNGNLTNLGINSGVVLSTGRVSDIDDGVLYKGSYDHGASGNSLIASLSGANTFDAAVIEFDFVPAFGTLSFSLVYSSEDYPEFVGGNAQFQDHIGAFITGANPSGGNYSNQNFVFVPNSKLPIIANNVNSTKNSQYFVNNLTGAVMFDGFTTLLETKIPVTPSASYHITIAIADCGDHISDAAVFLKSHSFKSYTNNDVSEFDKQELFEVYPNPAENQITINTIEKGKLTISTQLGQVIDNVNINDRQTQINTENLIPGIYFLSFQTDKNIVTRKLIVR